MRYAFRAVRNLFGGQETPSGSRAGAARIASEGPSVTEALRMCFEDPEALKALEQARISGSGSTTLVFSVHRRDADD